LLQAVVERPEGRLATVLRRVLVSRNGLPHSHYVLIGSGDFAVENKAAVACIWPHFSVY
jgi:hypothetical protein